MVLIENWLPPSRANWELIVYGFQFFPLVTVVQWFTTFYPSGKSSITSSLNIPGKIGWMTMESPGFLMVLYLMYTLPGHIGLNRTLPKENLFLGGLYVTHYLYRAILYPLLNPSMSPMHVLVWASAFLWQLANGISIGGFLGGYGPTTAQDWAGQNLYIECGLMLWIFGFALNIWHDDELREIRRAALRRQKKDEKDVKGKTVDKVYYVPKNGLFWVILYPHYLMEWVEWFGWWMMAGWGCVPARNFVINEITTMLPRAIQGRRWYIEKFGREKVGSRKAVIPGLI